LLVECRSPYARFTGPERLFVVVLWVAVKLVAADRGQGAL
jgi:hypothetical protein